MKRILMGILLTCILCQVIAENNPYRNDCFWVTVPDNANWLYETGEKATIEVQLYKYGIPQNGVIVEYELAGDMMSPDKKGKVVLKNGRAIIDMGTMNTPGFRDCRMLANIDGKIYKHHIKVGFSPEKIKPYTKMPDDFMDFWQSNLKKDKEFPLKYSKELVKEYCTDLIDCYLIRLELNKKGQCVYGYLFYPKGAEKGKHPVVLCPPGAGVKTIKQPMRHKYYAENGFIRLEMEIHGLNPTMTDEQFKEISNALNFSANGYLYNGLDNRDNYYMKRVYLSMIRCIDLLTSLPEWDGKNVAVQGGSQGGALALITAGLDKRVTHCVANHPALTDMSGYVNGHAGGYPHFFKIQGMDTDEKLKTMAYYDVVNFARFIQADTFMTWGFNDDVCPPTTSYAAYNVLNSFKEALITPINEHWTSEDTEYALMEWIKGRLR